MNRRALLAATLSLSACSLDSSPVEPVQQPVATSNLVINEFTAGSGGKVEIYNGTAADIDASGWQVDDVAGAGAQPKALPAGSVVPAGGLLLMSFSGINYASADQVRLLDGQGNEVDAHDNYYAGSSINGLCFGRQPDGGGWAAADIPCSLGASNGGATCSPSDCDDGNPCTEETCDAAGQCGSSPVADGTACGGGWVCAAGSCVGAPSLTINEFKGGSGGWIEVHNAGAADVDLTGWSVDDVDAAGAQPKAFPGGTVVSAGGFVSLSFSGINTASADQVRLLDAVGGVVDSRDNYWAGSSIAGLCFGRLPDGGDWAAAAIDCSRDASNCTGNNACGPSSSGGDGIHTLLRGTVVGPAGPYVGEVLIEGDTITCAAPSCAATPGASTAAVVDTHGIILPGMLDAHNHILFDIFNEDDWSPPKVYANHDQWPNDARYGAMVDAKQYLNGEAGSPVKIGCEMLKYGELKGLIAGTTSIQGSANPANKSCYASLARTIDQSPNDLGHDNMQTATIFPTSTTADKVCTNYDTGTTTAYVIHIGEGVDEHSRAEFDELGTVTTTDQCLYAPQTTIIHGTALGDPEMQVMADQGMSLVWSPRSNVFLYGGGTDYSKTTNIPLALSKGINVALAPDWSIGGSQNLLDELRFAAQVSAAQFGGLLTPRMLFEMVTINAARALALDAELGSIEAGKKADLFVIPAAADPYAALLATRPKDIALVMVGGTALYGSPSLQSLAPASPGCETLDVCGTSKFVCVAEDGGTATDKLGQTLAEITSVLSTELAAYDALDLTQWDFSPIAPLTTCE